MAREIGLDLASIHGTGPGGRIVKKDILQASDYTNTVHRRHEFAQVTKKLTFVNVIRKCLDRIILSGRLIFRVESLTVLSRGQAPCRILPRRQS